MGEIINFPDLSTGTKNKIKNNIKDCFEEAMMPAEDIDHLLNGVWFDDLYDMMGGDEKIKIDIQSKNPEDVVQEAIEIIRKYYVQRINRFTLDAVNNANFIVTLKNKIAELENPKQD